MGVAAAVCTTVSFVPQLLRVWRRKRADDISLAMFLIYALGVVLWLVYGVEIGAFAVVLANCATLGLTLVILVLKVRYDRQGRLERMEAERAEAGRNLGE